MEYETPEAEVTESKPSRTDAIIDQWFADHFPNSPVAQNTAIWNLTLSAKEDLKRRLLDQI